MSALAGWGASEQNELLALVILLLAGIAMGRAAEDLYGIKTS